MNIVNIIYVNHPTYKQKKIFCVYSNEDVNKFQDYMLSLYNATDDPLYEYTYEPWQVRGEN